MPLHSHREASDYDLLLAVERSKRHNRRRTRHRDTWDRDLWNAYIRDAGPPRAANERPPETA